MLHVSPHPDDESIGAPATLLALRDAGWRIVNVACSLGAPEEQARREAELREACRRSGFLLEVVDQARGVDGLRNMRSADAEPILTSAVRAALDRYRPDLVVAPSPHDRHPGHEVVGRAVVAALAQSTEAPPLWLWGLWADLPLPTLAVSFGADRLAEIVAMLEAHSGELGRNDYRRLVRGRAEMNASLGPERVFGFGASANEAPYLELLTEVTRGGDCWRLGHPRWLDPAVALGPNREADGADVTEWLEAPSITARFGPPPSARP